LDDADQAAEKVAVHCSGGIGRTGQVLAAWLIHARGYTVEAATVMFEKCTGTRGGGRRPMRVGGCVDRMLSTAKAGQSPARPRARLAHAMLCFSAHPLGFREIGSVTSTHPAVGGPEATALVNGERRPKEAQSETPRDSL
jgi:hypothetical protein